jgi:hypothetical protein
MDSSPRNSDPTKENQSRTDGRLTFVVLVRHLPEGGGTLAPESIMIIWEDRVSHFSLSN